MAKNTIAFITASLALAAAICLLPTTAVKAASPVCSEISAKLAEAGGHLPERTRLLRLSVAHGCAGGDAAAPVDGLRGAGSVAGVRIIRPGVDGELALAAPFIGDPDHILLEPQRPGIDPNGSYRTMCVRTCDGYYFPISYAVMPAHFAADRQACERRCPGSDVRLYFHRVPEEDAERMISASDGTPYTALPHAFLYRAFGRKSSGSCACQETAGGFSDLGGTSERGFRVLSPSEESAAPTVEGSIVTIPAPAAPAPAETTIRPATPAPVIEPARQATVKPVEEAKPDVREPVRVIGPKFFPDPSKAEVLRAPGPTPGP